MKRKQKFSIQTNRMTDEVYDFLLTKVEGNQLSRYIIALVEQDMTNGRIKQVNHELDDIFEMLSKVKHLLTPSTAPISNEPLEDTLIKVEQIADDQINLDAEVESMDLDF